MPLRVRRQKVMLNGGKYEGFSALALVPLFNAEGSVNVRIVKPGIVRTIDGFDTLNETPVTTDTGGDATRCVGVEHYFVPPSGPRREVGVFTDDAGEYEIWHSTDNGATWTFLKDLSSASIIQPPVFDQFGSRMLMCFGHTINVQEYDGTSVADTGQVQPAQPTVTTLGAGNLTGTFKYKYAVIDSDGDIGPASVASDPRTKDKKRLEVTFTAAGGGNLGIRLWRTTGDGEFYFWLADVEGTSATTYEDNIDDRTLLSRQKEPPSDGDAPPAGARFVMFHRNRALYLGTTSQPAAFFYSDPDQPDSVPAGNVEFVGAPESDEFVTGWPEYDGIAVLYQEHTIWTLEGDGRLTYVLRRSQAQAGTVGKHSVALVPELKFRDLAGNLVNYGRPVLVHITANADARLFDGQGEAIISAGAKETFESMSYEHRNQAWVRVYPPYNWVVFGIPTDDQTYVYAALDYTQGTWHAVDFLPNVTAPALAETVFDNNRFLAGDADGPGTVYELFTGSSADGSDITATVRTIPIHHGAPMDNQVLLAVGSVFEAQASPLTVTLNVYNGPASNGASAFATASLELEASGEDFTTLDPEFVVDTNGANPRGKMHVLEWTRMGTTAWGLAGWETHRQDEPQPYGITS